MNAPAFVAPLRIEAAHPALPGHFPGRPVAPGVVLLQRVATALRQWRDRRMTRVDAKFLAPLPPERDARIELEGEGARVRFTIRDDDTVFARGTLEAA